jgi:zinc-binding alcohol dehydrogenase/oxidoreductase
MRTMDAIVLHEIKNIDSMNLEQVLFPEPKAGEAVVKIKASAMNHRDVWIVNGLYAKIHLPVILGSDGAGIVHTIGNDVDVEWLNQEVIINPTLGWGPDPGVQRKDFRILGMPDNGTQAQYVVVPASNIVKKPAHLSFEEAAAIPLGGVTGYRALFTQGKLRAGETVLITGIGGGVATLIMQMALAAGAQVIVTSGSEEKIEKAVKAGAIGGANYQEPDWPAKLQSILGNREIDLVIDSAGGKDFPQLFELVRYGGRVVTYGVSAGNPENLNLRRIFWKQITLQGSTMGSAMDFFNMVRLFESRKIRPVIDSVHSFDRFRDAYKRMMDSAQFGKIILKP